MAIGKSGDTQCFAAALELFVALCVGSKIPVFGTAEPRGIQASYRRTRDRAGTVKIASEPFVEEGRVVQSREIAVRRGEIG